MTRRSRGREVALQLLFQREHNAKMDRAAMEQFVRDRLNEEPLRKFCLFLFDGVVANLPDIDAKISAAAENWRLSRMPTVDRNILRLGAFELLFMQDTPPAVVFDSDRTLAPLRYGGFVCVSSTASSTVCGRSQESGSESGRSQSQESVVRILKTTRDSHCS